MQEFNLRAQDWRNGAVVYQIFLDRFAPSDRLQEKRHLYTSPRKLRAWSELPKSGKFLEQEHVWAQELEFWGGDLPSLRSRLDYLEGLGVDVIYLNPVFEALTNHKYDTWDYHKVDPAYGTRQELGELCQDLHQRNMRLILDGVFNHMGRQSPFFQQEASRDFFCWHPETGEAVGWLDVHNLPELNLENPKVRQWLWGQPDSVVQSYLRQENIDGWRLDVAFDLGFAHLSQLTEVAHQARPGCAIVGEVWNYPEEWSPALDGILNMHGRALLLRMLDGTLPAPLAARMWETMVADAGLDMLLKSWLVLDNHDTPRLCHTLRKPWQVRMARALQFFLPGCVCLYYGSELGMSGGNDPKNRAPMRWDLVDDENKTLAFHRRLLALRKSQPALRYGDFRRLHSQQAFAFLRRTESAKDTIVVLANPSDEPVRELIQVRDSRLHDLTVLRDLLGGSLSPQILGGCIEVKLAPHQVVLLQPDVSPYPKGYQRYRRMP